MINVIDVTDYVGTREAAKLLGVSEASVRRWSDAGLLATHRVGRRGERRFMRADVLDLKWAGRRGRSESAAQVAFEGSPVPIHSHLTSFYTSDRGRLRLGLPFLRQGIVAGQPCILIANEQTARIYEKELELEDVSMSQTVESGRFRLLSPFPSYDDGLEILEGIFSEFTRRGALVIRVLGEAIQNRDQMGSRAELLRFEEALNPLVRRFPVVMLCQYDARRMEAVDLVEVMKAHADIFEQPLGMFLN